MTTDTPADYYAEFGIDRSATTNEISRLLDRAFRTWSSRASLAPDATKRREAEDRVELVRQARWDLLDRARRAAYDHKLATARQRPSSEQRKEPAPEPQPDPPHLRDWVGQARARLDRKDYEGALYELRQAVYHDDENGDAWQLLGWLHLKLGEPREALQEFLRALPHFPHEALIRAFIAHTHEQLGDSSTAASWYLAAARLVPHDADAQVMAADSLHRAGRHDEALSTYEQALARRPSDRTIRDRIGRIWSLRAEGAMVWHPVRMQYVIASADSVPVVTHCVEQALAAGVSDPELVQQLNTYRLEAGTALARTWHWRRGTGPVVILCAIVMFMPEDAFHLLGLAGVLGLPIAMGLKPRWKHTYDDVAPYLGPQAGRFP
ncbi:tetratricopeptide repeat protein [Streptomyces odontomachi]|uniref:tetratricopeptide repeat protein n=1 Tax=Streptomyces odontomachi TaxID=2944940 RepID=UPI00210C14BC|nr:tetratricopeptide repeat protein [Streptomyces sp. ODS25]